eukprot:g4938.t1
MSKLTNERTAQVPWAKLSGVLAEATTTDASAATAKLQTQKRKMGMKKATAKKGAGGANKGKKKQATYGKEVNDLEALVEAHGESFSEHIQFRINLMRAANLQQVTEDALKSDPVYKLRHTIGKQGTLTEDLVEGAVKTARRSKHAIKTKVGKMMKSDLQALIDEMPESWKAKNKVVEKKVEADLEMDQFGEFTERAVGIERVLESGGSDSEDSDMPRGDDVMQNANASDLW